MLGIPAAMNSSGKIPVSPSVLAWLIDHSGYQPKTIEEELSLPAGRLAEWLSSDSQLSIGDARRLAKLLKRPFAVLLSKTPPIAPDDRVSFRAPIEAERQRLSPEEWGYIRESMRVQRTARWIRRELEESKPFVFRAKISDDAEKVAHLFREILSVGLAEQVDWKSASKAFRRWRRAVESLGIFVFVHPMGVESCRGFSIGDEEAPIVGINSAWNKHARIFTLFHEVGHLITRTQSACLETSLRGGHFSRSTDKTERWCEEFSAALLMPWSAVRDMLGQRGWDGKSRIADLATARWLANQLSVSLRAAVLRLIQHRVADWQLYYEIKPATEQKSGGAAGGRVRQQISEDVFGRSLGELMARGIDRGLISTVEAASHLRVSYDDLDSFRASD